ncbi:uncharacterized protein [Primulina eburnea]|uniref:uncharacterized protein n=1 Tax=Primulina eburnea TaxID=1245227 RepID=UPI003C6C3498
MADDTDVQSSSQQCMLRSHSPDLLIFDPEIERSARRLRKARREEIQTMAENREDVRYNPPDAIPIRDHFRPVINAHYSGIARWTINANNFELKPALINMVQQNQFAETSTADPHVHLRTFLEITDTELATKFLSKYFPPAKSAQLKIEISTFRQTDFEQLYEAWERYKELLRKCPNHGFEDWVKIELFYNGLNGQTRTTVDAATGGTIFAKSPAQAYDLLEQMTINSYQWPSERSGVQRTAGIYVVDPITSLTAQVSALTTQITTMNKVGTSNTEGPPVVVEESNFPEEVQYINNNNFGGFGGYRVGTFVVESGKRMSRTESRLDNLETHMASNGATLKILESQVGQITKQLTSQPSGEVQKTADPNLREVNSIFIHQEKKRVELTPVQDEKLSPTKGARGKKSERYELNKYSDISLLPYPQRFLQLQAKFRKKKGLKDLKNLHTNNEFVDQVEGEVTEGTQRNLPQKLLDPGEFIVPCEIGGHLVEKAICDSGASINIMPSSLYEKLGLSKMRSTELSVQLADKSVKVPLGIVEDVELKIDKLKVLAEFLVLDMENSKDVHVILGRPLLAAVGAIIDVKRGNMTMEVEGQMVAVRASKKSYDLP